MTSLMTLHVDCCIVCMQDVLARKVLQQHWDVDQPRALLCLAVLLTIIKEKLACFLLHVYVAALRQIKTVF